MKKIIAIVCGIVLLFLIAIPVGNDYAAKRTAEDILSVPLPEGTSCLEKAYLAGKLVGNGNGMQYFGAVLLKSERSLDELQQYYSSYAGNEWTYIAAPQQGSAIDIIEHGHLEFQSRIDGAGFYIVYSWGSSPGIFADFDLRGH